VQEKELNGSRFCPTPVQPGCEAVKRGCCQRCVNPAVWRGVGSAAGRCGRSTQLSPAAL